MAVRFILGMSGTGKTRHCIDAISASLLDANQTHPLILLVPEQATYQAERAILAVEGIGGYSRLHVLSFQRLEFMLQGRYKAGTELSRIAQQLIIHRILRQNSKSLKVFGASSRHPGLAAEIAETIVELHQYGQSPDDVKNLAGRLDKNQAGDISTLKFTDIALIYSEYIKHVEGRFINPDMQLTNACKAVAGADFLKGAHLWVDGFSGFTEQELAMLRELLKTADESHIALCLDPAANNWAGLKTAPTLDPLSIFSPTERTLASLLEIIKKNNLVMGEPIILQKSLRFALSPQLEHIEKNLFNDEPEKIQSGEAVEIIAAANARAEVEYIGRRIISLVREQKWRYRDIAVVASDLGAYRHYIQAAFADCGIPFFIDMAKPVNQHPVVEAILSALQVIINGFESSDVFAFLKTDLLELSRNEVDALENYCLACGISGAVWKKKFDDPQMDEIRKRAVGPLVELEAKFNRDAQPCVSTAGQFRKIVDEFLQAIGVNEKLAAWIENGDENRQFVRQLAQLFDEFSQIFGEDYLELEDFAALLAKAFEQMSLRLIPPSLDQVLVGSIERSRHPDLKAIFLIGASQKQFPVPMRFDSILTDDDRAKAESAGCRLAEGTAMQLAQRQYLVYIAYTRPCQLLCVSYPMADDEGAAIPPSPFVANLQALFTDLKPKIVGYELPAPSGCTSEHELADLLCSNTDTQDFTSLLSAILNDGQIAHIGKTVLAAINYHNQAVLEPSYTGIGAGQIRSSVTRLSSFAACPYQYFARHTLKLEKRDVYSFEPPDLGKFYHQVLCKLFENVKSRKLDVTALKEKEIWVGLNDAVAAVMAEDTFYVDFTSRNQFNQYIIAAAVEVLESFVNDTARMMRAGRFRQIAAEIPFEYKIRLSGKRELLLVGCIDRIDVADGENVAIIFDYKSSNKDFNWAKCYHGLDLQLVLYIQAIEAGKICDKENIEAVGAFYMPINVGTQSTNLDELESKAEKFCRKAKGIFDGAYTDLLNMQADSGWNQFYNFCVSKDGQYGHYNISGALKSDDFAVLMTFARTKIVELANRIAAGDIAIRPYRLKRESPCENCELRPLCRFDWHINDYNFMKSMNKAAVLAEIGGDNGK